MATVQIADIYEPLTFAALAQEASVEKNALIASGVVVERADITAQASAGGRIGDMPAFKPLTRNEPNYSSDDNTSFSTPDNINSGLQHWRLAAMNKSWSAMDFATELALTDPVTAITSSIGGYWATVEQTRVVKSCLGILADNLANDGGDMVYSIATDDAGAVTAAEKISAEAIIIAASTLGDKQTEFVAIAVHGTVFTTLRLNNLIDVVEDSEGNTIFFKYQGMFLIVDDSLPAVAGTNRITYTSILFKNGVFGMGNGIVKNPSEYERKPSSGDGGGEEIIYSRVSRIIHPWGMDFTSASVAGPTPTYAELAAAGNWNRIFSRKNVGIAFLQTNG